jgi:hypothetical protein
MKTAKQLFDELVQFVRPPKGCVLEVVEQKPNSNSDQNWTATAGASLSGEAGDRFSAKVSELRKSSHHVDWSNVTDRRDGRRRLTKWR